MHSLPALCSLPPTVIFMGVCGCGKTLIGQNFADAVGGVFEDADHFHPKENVAKMSAGIPLTDEDRWPWYAALRARILEMRGRTPCYVLACSALKQTYRDALRDGDPACDLVFIYLDGSRELIARRMAGRKGHYMPPSLIDSQFAILEEPADAIRISIDQTPDEILRDVLRAFGR
jgi:gluconokinase